jgi:hypothetical protein
MVLEGILKVEPRHKKSLKLPGAVRQHWTTTGILQQMTRRVFILQGNSLQSGNTAEYQAKPWWFQQMCFIAGLLFLCLPAVFIYQSLMTVSGYAAGDLRIYGNIVTRFIEQSLIQIWAGVTVAYWLLRWSSSGRGVLIAYCIGAPITLWVCSVFFAFAVDFDFGSALALRQIPF